MLLMSTEVVFQLEYITLYVSQGINFQILDFPVYMLS